MRLHWHRRDLRLSDNRGLAVPDEPPLGVFVLDGDVLEHASSVRVAFLLDALASLRTRYRDRGSELFVRRGDPAAVLRELSATLDADAVSWNHDYSGLADARDERVADALRDADVPVRTFHDALCHEPGSITTADGDHYAVYTYFWKKWRDRPKDDPFEIPTLAGFEGDATETGDETGNDRGTTEAGEIPDLETLGFDSPEAALPDADPGAARERLESFLDGDVRRYGERRDYPADGCTSRLSPHLKFGTIGVRTVDRRVRETKDGLEGEARESVEEFRSQLAWREFYAHVLAVNPGTVTENYRAYENEIDWENDPEFVSAWRRGETGYPIVDAGMRQLLTEAFVHNRVRMIVASFLTKDLLVDWRYGYEHFREHLVDHDTANDVGGWQWAASTGTDAQPYFRIFNPVTQGERYDPDAEYIRRYVPELEGVDPDLVHDWTELSPSRREAIAPDYPAPVVDHARRRERALEMFRAARGED